MLKFRAAVMAITLTLVFFIPMTAIPKEIPENLPENPPEQSSTLPEEEEQPEAEPEPEEKTVFRIFDAQTEEIKEVPYFDYVRGAIAAEMPASFEQDALIAQGVAAFSCGLYQKEINSDADYDFSAAPEKRLGYITEEKAREIYGDDFKESWAKITAAAKTAAEHLLTYEGKPAMAVYHATSNGKTESAKEAWGGEIPYLVSVESPEDKNAKDYKTTVTVKKEKALEILNKYGALLNGKAAKEWFEGAELTEAGYVKSIQIGAATFSGDKLRSLFDLRSSCFTVAYADGEFTFTVFGYGHGVGLSQTGANAMAKSGKDYEEILSHYYPGTALEKYPKE